MGLLLLSGCFAQANLGAQRSPDGSWIGAGGILAGIKIDIGERADVGAGVAGSITGYSTEDGGGYAFTQPAAAVANVRVVDGDGDGHALAVSAQLAGPWGSAAYFAPDGADDASHASGSRVTRALLAIGDDYRARARDMPDFVLGRLRAGLGIETFVITGPDRDLVTFGPVATFGYTLTWAFVDCLLSREGTFGCPD